MNRKRRGIICIGLGLVLAFSGLTWRSVVQAANEAAGEQVLRYQNKNPGWLPPGSVWICASNGRAFVQISGYNTNGLIINSNIDARVISNFAGSPVFTNIFVSSWTSVYSTAVWSNGVTWATNGQNAPN